jgi:endonuclease/exonuclease/phosphatase family metal-dependent hydrolase
MARHSTQTVVLAFLVMPLAISCVMLTGTSRGDVPLDVKVLTFNIRYDNPKDGPNRWASRREMAAGLIRRFDGDFVCLQEVLPRQKADLLKMLPDYRAVGRSREADAARGEASPILYSVKRWKLDEKQQGTFWLSDTPETPGSITWGNACPRIVTWARFVEEKTGRGLYIYNTHFDHVSESSRQKSAALLARRIADRKSQEPVLLAGDFNSGESSAALAYLTSRTSESPIKLIDTFREAHPKEKRVGTFHAFRGGDADEKIDYVLALPGAKVRSAEILREHQKDRYPSDHYPVTCEVTFAP